MNRLAFSFFGVVLCATAALATHNDPPLGFEDPSVLSKVMGGQIVLKDTLETKVEFRTVAKAFFKKVSPDAYIALAVNHPKYKHLFSEVKSGETTHVSADKSTYDYKLHLRFSVGPFSQDVYPEGRQRITLATDAVSEATIDNEILNYKEDLKSARQVTRLIPYEDGILVHDEVHVVLHKPSSQTTMVKKKLKEFFTKYVAAFRKDLQGDY